MCEYVRPYRSDNQWGIVIIGRNEGERLHRCFQSIMGRFEYTVYVDSGSTDGSVALAKKIGVTVISLDMSISFTAARGRNAGFVRLLEVAPDIKYVQFVDGDCEIIHGWLEEAVLFLESQPKYAVVCGRLRERDPSASVYNQLCEVEWDGPIGNIYASGGIFMIRRNAFEEVDGMDSNIVAGEEPEMCLRLRSKGWEIRRIEHDMAWHDAAITKFSQWWRRAIRSGHAYAQVACLHWRDKEIYQIKNCLRIWFWGGGVPVFWVVASVIYTPLLLLGPVVYVFQFQRIYRNNKHDIKSKKIAMWYAWSLVIVKFPQLWGQIIFFWKRVTNRKPEIIEYKK